MAHGNVHALHLPDHNRTSFRSLDAVLVVIGTVVGLRVLSGRGNTQVAANTAFVAVLVLGTIGGLGF